MCGRFYIEQDDSSSELQKIIDAVNRKVNGTSGVKVSGEIFPSDAVAVLAGNQVVPMRWGYHLGRKLVINARSESVTDNGLFSQQVPCQRCLIPASGYFEWERKGASKVRHAISREGSLIYMAGLYRFEPNEEMLRYVILTCAAAPQLQYIHSRMPVVLEGGLRRAWLEGFDARDVFARASMQFVERVG